jgi:predicted nuclease of restriction endonuclease-like (RecB) superfamily
VFSGGDLATPERAASCSRPLLSRNKRAMLVKGEARRGDDVVIPEEEIKDPFVLEFLGLKDEHSETDLEDARNERWTSASAARVDRRRNRRVL